MMVKDKHTPIPMQETESDSKALSLIPITVLLAKNEASGSSTLGQSANADPTVVQYNAFTSENCFTGYNNGPMNGNQSGYIQNSGVGNGNQGYGIDAGGYTNGSGNCRHHKNCSYDNSGYNSRPGVFCQICGEAGHSAQTGWHHGKTRNIDASSSSIEWQLSGKVGRTDRISELSEALKMEILYRLPGKDGVRMTSLSKTWKSLPIRYVSFDISKDLSTIDETLRILNEETIGCLRLTGRFEASYHTHVDSLLKVVTKHSIKGLVLHFCDYYIIPIKYRFPPINFDGRSLVSLSLDYCMLAETLIQDGTSFSCLREIAFRNVDLKGLVDEFLNRCPSIETLKLIYCTNLKVLKLCGHPKLRTVEMCLNIEVLYYCKINEANLQSLHYVDFWGYNSLLDLGAVECSNLKELKVDTRYTTVMNDYVEKLSSKFPYLEKLELSAPFKLDVAVSSHRLKELIIYNYGYQEISVHVDTPNLLYYRYCPLGNILRSLAS